jgi:hypothetical protein
MKLGKAVDVWERPFKSKTCPDQRGGSAPSNAACEFVPKWSLTGRIKPQFGTMNLKLRQKAIESRHYRAIIAPLSCQS